MNNFIERLHYYMTSKGINDNQLTIAANLSVGLIGKAKNSGKGMSSANIEKILLAYPDLSPDWLLTGRGQMLKPSVPYNITQASDDDYEQMSNGKDKPINPEKQEISSIISQLLDTIKEQAEEIGRLKTLINEH